MRIVYLNPTGHLGGAERALLDLMAGVRAANPDWRLTLITTADGELVAQARTLGVAAAVVPLPPSIARLGDAGAGGPAGNQTALWRVIGRLCAAAPAMGFYSRKLGMAIADAQPDLVHSNGFKMHVLGAWSAPRGTPLLWHIHDYVRARPMMSRLLRLHSRRCALMVANSKSVAADVRAALGVRTPIFAVYYGIDLEHFSPAGNRSDLDALAGMMPLGEGGLRIIGLVTTMARWKGHETFLRAQGFTGFVDDAAAAMRSLDVVVHASTEPEPFGLVIVEAMACGKALIASPAGGAGELVVDEVNALAHRPGDAASLARQIVRLAGDPELRARLGKAGLAMAAQRFSRARIAADMTPIYREFANGAS